MSGLSPGTAGTPSCVHRLGWEVIMAVFVYVVIGFVAIVFVAMSLSSLQSEN